LLVICFGYGFAAGSWRLPPYGLIHKAISDFIDLQRHWRNDLGLEPTRHLVRRRGENRGFVSLDRSRMAPGNRLIAGLTPSGATLHGVVLYDIDGRELHRWSIDYAALDPDGRDPANVYLHGLEVFQDGSIIVNFDAGMALARLGPCGTVRWVDRGQYHHVVSRSFDGTIWTWRDRGDMVQLEPETGKILTEISLMNDVVLPNELHGVFAIRTPEDENELTVQDGIFHANDIEILTPDLAPAFPMFAAGDLLISLRNLNLVAVIDSKTWDVKWWHIGPWHRQHDADFLPDGTISVFNNNMGLGRSQIVRINPQTGDYKVVLEGRDDFAFYTWIRGTHETLSNGNILVTESQAGRIFEIDREGALVWEFNNVFDSEQNGLVSRSMILPPAYFDAGVLDCGTSTASSSMP